MIAEFLKILNHEAGSLVREIKQNMASTGSNASGDTSESIEYEVEQKGLSKFKITILGRPYFMSVETGRKPTPDKKPSKEMIDNISRWLRARGKDQKLTWAIATSINKKGTKLFQRGGRNDIVSNVIGDTAMDELAQRLLNDFGDLFLNESAKIFDATNNNRKAT